MHISPENTCLVQEGTPICYDAAVQFALKFSVMRRGAGFAGVADFNFWQSGALLALNTFGPLLLLTLTLPLVCVLPPWLPPPPDEAAEAAPLARTANGSPHLPSPECKAAQPRASLETRDTSTAALGADPRSTLIRTDPLRDPALDDEGGCDLKRQLRVATLAFVTVRTLNAVVATVSAAVQRRHLMVWAIFAPKFLFDACILLACDAFVILVCSLAHTVGKLD